MAADYVFEGWLGSSPEAVNGGMKWGPFEPKKWQEDDVDVQISHCGVCGSDIHVMRSGWGSTPYPCCVGHEIVGKAVRVGSKVQHIKVGDRVGVGAQALSCLQPDCPECSNGHENYCKRLKVDTYGSVYPDDIGKSYGGYANYNRTNGRFVVKIPDGLPSEIAAPLLCGALTVWTPLRDNGCGPGKTVGIIGVGGLGHFAILFAKALGADKVVGISRKASKKADVLALGADQYIATEDDAQWHLENGASLDLIISTVSSSDIPLAEYLSLLKVDGSYIQVGAPDGGIIPPINAFTLLINKIKVGGSNTGSPSEIAELLQFVVDKNIKPWVQTRPLKEANQTLIDLAKGDAKYRYVLVNENHV